MDVAIIDSGGANIGSVIYALNKLGVSAALTTDAQQIRRAGKVILPGVGAAGAAMRKLRDHGLEQLIPSLTQPLLGICLGMQLLYEGSEEDDTQCLGILPGAARLFEPQPELTVPHMGWNRLLDVQDSPLCQGLDDNSYAYFVHSYALPVNDCTVASGMHGQRFSAMAARDNFYAAQFHPERSAATGARILKNFMDL